MLNVKQEVKYEKKRLYNSKKVLVVFYSRDGHTKRVAEIIADALNADIDKIEDKKSRKGLIGFIRAGYDATRGKTTDISFSKDPADYDVVILGGPVWNGKVTPAIRTYLLKNNGRIKKSVFFVTCAIGGGKCLSQMREIYNGEILAEKVILRSKIEEEIKQFIEKLESIIKNNKRISNVQK